MQTKQRSSRNLQTSLLWIILLSITASKSMADPCGMVPPIYFGQPPVLARVGEQQTYVFFKDGMETFVIRPGFTGDVDNFGMLIPFPTPPAIRKVPDNIFAQIAAAVDPPEVVINLNPPVPMSMNLRLQARGDAIEEELAFSEDSLRVIRREAVGMYEVAVLEAGSAAALKKWMDQNGFRYPTGMDAVCEDYVADRWCFVAVKTKVGQKGGVDPAPGQRKVDANLPAGAVFDGFVQGMGFRFQTEKLVVPMRLSAFNEGELRNIVYLLTDGPKRINSISQSTVRRQLTGQAMYRNLTDPLPLRLIGGNEQNLRKWHLEGLTERRNPDPKNGEAKRLFAADLLAARDGTLSLPGEETEKKLLAVGEHFGLRGTEIDALHSTFLKEEAEKTVKQALTDLSTMTLSVFDGDFPRNVVAEENLTFANYTMPEDRNKATLYDAIERGPAKKQPGIRKQGNVRAGISWWRLLGLSLFGAAGLVGICRRRGGLLVLLMCLMYSHAPTTEASDPPAIEDILNQLADPQQGEGCLDHAADIAQKYPERRSQITRALAEQATADIQLVGRGWTIAALANIPGQDVDELLLEIQDSPKLPMLVRTWAAAARVDRCRSAAALIEKAALISRFPALSRPIGKRLVAKLQTDGGRANVEQLLAISIRMPELQPAVGPMILAQNKQDLVTAMRSAKDQNVRRQAAAYLGTLASGGDTAELASAIVSAYAFDPAATDVPWQGGPLFIPGIDWRQEPAQARQLADQLIRWMLWCDRHGRAEQQRQIHNNLRSLNLARAAAYESPGWQAADAVVWLQVWRKVVGENQLEAMLTQQQVADSPRYRAALGQRSDKK
ncbi:MAG: DUF2330 domain-containing protein [Pirellulales bacterium]|nr:DUF2330 domain-containing protein [Pirellulales bacterium]